jgi:hypothetical protein
MGDALRSRVGSRPECGSFLRTVRPDPNWSREAGFELECVCGESVYRAILRLIPYARLVQDFTCEILIGVDLAGRNGHQSNGECNSSTAMAAGSKTEGEPPISVTGRRPLAPLRWRPAEFE